MNKISQEGKKQVQHVVCVELSKHVVFEIPQEVCVCVCVCVNLVGTGG